MPEAEAIAVRGNTIALVGSNKAVRKLAGPKTQVIDAAGKLVLPGFNDSHTHFIAIGNSFSSIDLRGAASYDEVARKITRYAEVIPKGRWILGRAWRMNEPPTPAEKAALDSASPDNPVLIYFEGGSTAWANAAAFEVAGIKNSPAGISRDAAGRPTGIVTSQALTLIKTRVPADHTRNWAELAETASNFAASLGITSIQDVSTDDRSDVYRELERTGKLKTRIYDCGSLPDLKSKRPAASSGNSMIRGGCVKGFYDGDPDWTAKLREDAIEADKNGWQVAVHAIGTSANREVADIFAGTIAANGSRDRRFRIEHAHDPAAEDINRFGKLGIVASIQPHLFRGSHAVPSQYSQMRDAGVPLALGSDAPMTDFDPLLTIFAAVSGERAMSVHDAVYAYTAGSAYAEFQEKWKGTIEAGKLADLVILSGDIFSIDKPAIPNIRVVTTLVNGRVVYQLK